MITAWNIILIRPKIVIKSFLEKDFYLDCQIDYNVLDPPFIIYIYKCENFEENY